MSLPKGWVSTKFTDLLDIQGGTQPPKNEFVFEPQEGYIRLLQIRDFGEKPVPTFVPDQKKLKKCEEDDVLIGRYGASVGRICTGMQGAYNVALAKVIKPDEVNGRYLKYYLSSDHFQTPLSLISRSAQNGFNKQDLSEIDFMLPPLNEQNRIAEKLDSVLAQADAVKKRLDHAPSIIKRFRQSVLAAATSGKLTEEWREAIGIAFEWENQCLSSIAGPLKYGSSSKSQKEGRIPVLRMGNIQNGELDWEDLVYTSDEEEINKYRLNYNDLVFNRTNSPELVGKTAIYKGEQEAIYAGYLIKITTLENLDPDYLNYVLNSPYGRDYCWRVKTDGVSQSNINAKKLGALEVPLPSIDEQKEIVSRVESLFAVADALEEKISAASKRVDKLAQSILAKAFRGELVPQDPNDGPAEKLLEKVKSNKKENR